MRKKIFWGSLLSSSVFVAFGMSSAGKVLSVSQVTPNFAVGQEWSIKSWPPSTARVVIGRIESWQDKIALHVSIVDIPSAQAGVGATKLTQIAHIPFEKSALAESVDVLVATAVAPPSDFEAGYRRWKEQHGRIFTISVEQAIGPGQQILDPHNEHPSQ